MGRLKGLLALLSALVLLPALAVLPAAADDLVGHWAEPTLRRWSDMGWFVGDGGGVYRPDDTISRAEFITLINKTKGFYEFNPELLGRMTAGLEGKWYYPEIGKALRAGYFGTGEIETYQRMEAAIQRQEAIAMIARVEGLDIAGANPMILNGARDADLIDRWAEPYVTAAVGAGLVTGEGGYLNPVHRMTRAEAVTLLDRIHAGLRIYAFPGRYGPEQGSWDADEVLVTAEGVSIRNLNVRGDLRVAASVGAGDLSFEQVSVFGALRLDGGGRALHIAGCRLSSLELNRPGTEALIDSDSTVGDLLLSGEDCRLELGGRVQITALTVTGAAELRLEEGADIGLLTLRAPADVLGGGLPRATRVECGGVRFAERPKQLTVAPGFTVGDYYPPNPSLDEEGNPIREEEGEQDEGPAVPATAVALDRRAATLGLGEQLILVKTLKPQGATDKSVTWSSSDEAVCTVTGGGRVWAVGRGEAVVTVKIASGMTATCTVTVE
ncbi:MAG: hypothetical protein GXX99_03915 [Clostridiales bacterium]|nr:hypothetical protein [Clostridiales bacterium]